MTTRHIGIGLLGYGNIGREVFAYFRNAPGVRIVSVARRRPKAPAPANVKRLMSANAGATIADPNVEIVVELTGDATKGRDYILEAIAAGKHVVTANKSALATYWPQITAAARKRGVGLGFEATVGGGMPVVRAMQRHIASDEVEAFAGILNGTCNYILTRMTEYILRHLDDPDIQKRSLPLEQALEQAQKLGFAEPDPTFDINGFDTKFKVAILANLAFGAFCDPNKIYCEGIWQDTQRIMPSDLYFLHHPKYLGGRYALKLVGVAQAHDGSPALRVHPALVERAGELADLAACTETYNGIVVKSKRLGAQFIKGRGAGPEPTAISIASDVHEIAASVADGGSGPSVPETRRGRLGDVGAVRTHGYIRSMSPDVKGIFAKKLEILARHNVNVESVVNVREFVYGKDRSMPDYIEIEDTPEGSVQKVLTAFRKLPGVTEPMYFRILSI
jgi:homoserine dehydrogenase